MQKFIFVYNADSGKLNALADSLHKLISPKTYQCRLCELTHGYFSEKAAWSEFLKEVKFDAEFLHKNEFLLKYQPLPGDAFPAVFELKNDKLSCLIDSKGFEAIKELSELCERLRSYTDC